MARDYNPDKESHRDHEWMVVKATTDPTVQGVATAKGNLRFGKDGAFKVSDPGLANEIRETVGMNATVSRVSKVKAADRGHRYFFGSLPEMPWKRKKNHGEIQEPQEATGQATEAKEEAAQPDYLHADIAMVHADWETARESWAYAGGMAIDEEE
jgi:hypothetical protein